MADTKKQAESSSSIQASVWTPELRADFQAHVQKWYEQHPEIGRAQTDYWDSPEGRKAREEMSHLVTGRH